MRLSTRLGTFRIVQITPSDDGDGAVYHVSSQDRAELENLVQSAGLRAEIRPAADVGSPWHFAASQRDLLDLMSALAETVNYNRF